MLKMEEKLEEPSEGLQFLDFLSSSSASPETPSNPTRLEYLNFPKTKIDTQNDGLENVYFGFKHGNYWGINPVNFGGK